METPDALGHLDRSMQYVGQRPCLLRSSLSCNSGLHGCMSCSLHLLPHLSSFARQPVHSLLAPHGCHGAEVSKKLALGLREQHTVLVDCLLSDILIWNIEKVNLCYSSHPPTPPFCFDPWGILFVCMFYIPRKRIPGFSLLSFHRFLWFVC